jgi:hypothetical protein
MSKTKRKNLAKGKRQKTATQRKSRNPAVLIERAASRWITGGFWRKVGLFLIILAILGISGMYGIARYYMAKYEHVPVQFGATFIPDYARHYDLDPQETMTAMIDDLGLKRLRLVSYWKNGEPERGKYNFDELDWQFRLAEEKGVDVSLAIGLRQPRWPECHMPKWAEPLPKDVWAEELKDYMREVILRYKDSPALVSYQLENEYFLKVFGECPDHSRDRLIDEFNFVRSLDPDTTLVVSMSNNAIGTPIGEPTPDQWAISVYKRVWDKDVTKRYLEYPIPAWYYGFRAGFTELTRGHNSFIHELQAESWTPGTLGSKHTPLVEQYKSMNAERLHHRMEYGRATGMKKVDLWGVEWWYYLKVHKNDPSIWDAGRAELSKTDAINAKLLQ